jgi:hypothetical protein
MQPRKYNLPLIYGLIAGLAMILLLTLLYLGGVNTYMGKLGYFSYVILIVLATVAALQEKKAQDGYLEFRDALKVTFLVFVIGLAMYTFFNWLLLNYIDPPFRREVERVALQKAEKMMQDWGFSQDKIDEMEAASKRNTSQNSFFYTVLALALWYIAFFVVALIISAIIKKKKPEFNDKAFK